MDENNYIEKQLSDHEHRLRRLEESDVAQRIELSAISKSQSEIKLMMAEQSKEQMKQTEKQQDTLNAFTKDMLNYFKGKENKTNKLKFYNTKQFWGIASMIIGGLLAYFGLK